MPQRIIICRLDRCLPEQLWQQWFNQAAQTALNNLFNEVQVLPEFVALRQQSSLIPDDIKSSNRQLQVWLLSQHYNADTEAHCLAMVALCIELALEQGILQPMSVPNLFESESALIARCIICHWWPVRLQYYHFNHQGPLLCMDQMLEKLESQKFVNSLKSIADSFNLPIQCVRSKQQTILNSNESFERYWLTE